MKDKWVFGISGGVAVILVSILLLFDMFSATTFGIVLLFSFMYLARFFYIRFAFLLDEKNRNEFFGRRKKFDWCWNRVNAILRQMDGGQGIVWDSGKDVASSFTNYHDGISNKPFRSFKAYQEYSANPIIIIYDIDGDDIVKIIQSPNPDELYDNFHNFKPYQGNVGYGGYGQIDDYNGLRRPRENVSINVGGYERKYDKPQLEPDEDAVANALQRVR